ncbi:MAG: SusD/RagB family nutrient-binding outer membrane lipoprotein [Bacteroidota bacterium]
MKKQIILFLAAILLFSVSCQDELEKDFINPGVYTPTENVPAGMFASMMSRTRTFKNDYGEFWWHANAGGMISHVHLIMRHVRDAYSFYSDLNDVPAMYNLMSVDAYFYGHNRDFKELPIMEQLIEEMTDQEKTDNEIYVTLGNMVRGYRASKAVDLYNSVPYSEALQGVNGEFFPKFDDPKEIYKSIIADLGTYADLVVQQESAMSADGKRLFKQQDIILKGDAAKWQQWANAVRLRLAVRISGVEEDYAKQVISEILSKNNLPSEDLLIDANLWVSEPGNHWKRGVRERDYAGFISPALINKMDIDLDHVYTPGTDDPRLPVLILPNRDTLYMPVSMDFGVGQKVYNHVSADNNAKGFGGGAYYYYNWFQDLEMYMKKNAYSVYNPATMVRNREPWRAFTHAEVDLLLAEVELKGLGSTGSSAEDHIKNSVINSIDYWYHMNSFTTWDKIDESNSYFLKPTAPDQGVKEQFADVIAGQYNAAADLEAKMEVIMGQKYVHLNIHDYFEVFAELRRTKHPKLPLMRFTGNVPLKPLVERYPYPGSESATNKDALAEVVDQDNFTSPIFWVPANKRTELYYEDDYNQDYLYIKYEGVPESFPGN